MSKPRSRLIDYARVFRTVRGFTTELHFGKQAKRMRGQSNFDPVKSEITVDIQALQHLVELYAGTGIGHSSGRETVDFGQVIGVFVSLETGVRTPTTRGTIHYSKSGAHVVPSDPNPKKKGRVDG